jgi:transketolase
LLGKGILLHPGREVVVFTTGGITANAIHASIILEKQQVLACIVDMHTIKPLDMGIIEWACGSDTEVIITIEEHSKIGGLGSAVAEVLAGMKQHPPLVRLGTDDCYPDRAMSYEELLKANHLDVDGIVKEVLDALR